MPAAVTASPTGSSSGSPPPRDREGRRQRLGDVRQAACRGRGRHRVGGGVDQAPHTRGPGRDGEPPVQQQGGLVGGAQRHVLGAHHADHQPPPVALGGGDVGVPGGVGEACLAAQVPRGVGQRVLVLDLVAGGAALHRGHLRDRRPQQRDRGRVRDQPAEDQREVVGRGGLAGDVQSGRRPRDGVVGADRRRHLVHGPHGDVGATGRSGQGAGRVVARLHHQRLEQQSDRVAPAGHQADLAALHRLVLDRALDDLRRVQQREERQQGQGLQRAGRVVAAVRIAGGQHRAAAGVGHQPAGRDHTGRQRGSAVGDDGAAGVQPLAAHGDPAGPAALRRAARDRRRGRGRGRVGGGPGLLGQRRPGAAEQQPRGQHRGGQPCCRSSHGAHASPPCRRRRAWRGPLRPRCWQRSRFGLSLGVRRSRGARLACRRRVLEGPASAGSHAPPRPTGTGRLSVRPVPPERRPSCAERGR